MDEQNNQPKQPMPPEGVPVQQTQAMPQQAQPVQETQPMPTQQTQPMPTQAPAPGQVPVGQPIGQSAAGYAPSDYAASGYATPAAQPPKPTAALVLGILSIVFCEFPIGLILGIIAIVLAGKYFKAGGTEGTGKAGRICGIIGIVLSVISLIAIIGFTVFGLSVLDDYDTSGRYIGEEVVVEEEESSSAAASSSLDVDEQELFAVANPQMDKLKNQDPQTVAAVASIMENSLNDALESENITLAQLGVDSTALAKSMLEGFDYEESYANAYDDEASASYDVTVKSIYDVTSEFYTTLQSMLDDASKYGSVDAAYAAIGQALMDAVDSTTPSYNDYVTLELVKSGSSWTVDPDSWEDELEYLFEF